MHTAEHWPVSWVGANFVGSNGALTPEFSDHVACFSAKRPARADSEFSYCGMDVLAQCHNLESAQIFLPRLFSYPGSVSSAAFPRLTYLNLVSISCAGVRDTIVLFELFQSMPALQRLVVQSAMDLPEATVVPRPPFRLRSLRWAFGSTASHAPRGVVLHSLLSSAAHSLRELLLCHTLAQNGDSQVFRVALCLVTQSLPSLLLPHWHVCANTELLQSILASCSRLRALSLQLIIGRGSDPARRGERRAFLALLESLPAPLHRLEIYAPVDGLARNNPDWQAPAAFIRGIVKHAPALRALRSLTIDLPQRIPAMEAELQRLATTARLQLSVRSQDPFAWVQ